MVSALYLNRQELGVIHSGGMNCLIVMPSTRHLYYCMYELLGKLSKTGRGGSSRETYQPLVGPAARAWGEPSVHNTDEDIRCLALHRTNLTPSFDLAHNCLAIVFLHL